MAKAGGVLAAWTYGVITIAGEEVNRRLQHFYRDVIGPYWPPERRHVEDGYRSLPFPFAALEAPPFHMSADWTLPELSGYLRSWSSTARFVAARNYDPVADLERELLPLWHTPEERRRVRWPLSLRAGRI